MTPREKVLKAIENISPGECPMDFGGTAMSLCTSPFLQKMRDVLGFSLPPDRDIDGEWVDEQIQKYLNVDLRFINHIPPLVLLKEIDYKAYIEIKKSKENIQKIKDNGIKTFAVRHDFPWKDWTLEDIKKIKPNFSEPPYRYMDWYIKTAKKYRESGYATTFWVSGGFFEMGCLVRGYDNFAIDLVSEHDIVKTLFDVWLAEKIHQTETIVKPLAPYIDIFCYGDDWALQEGPFMSPEIYRKIIKPYFIEQYKKVHETAPDSIIFHHSCGSTYKLLEDIIDIGVDILNPIQPNAKDMEPEKLKEKANGRICFHGGIDLQYLLPFGMPDDVKNEAERRMKILGENGGYICAPAHSLPEDVPVENILALFSASRIT